MSDEELTAFLRDLPFLRAAAAADRIEALTAKLAKAVEGLRFYAEGRWPEDYPGGVLHDVDGVTHIDYGHKATATLAEIEGEKE